MFSCDEEERDVMYDEWKNCTDEYKEVKVLFIFFLSRFNITFEWHTLLYKEVESPLHLL